MGKTVQLALSAMLMVLQGHLPALVIVPKPLTMQWQDELRDLLGVPSAVWRGGEWLDEQGIVYPALNAEAIKKCPRRIGIISQGLITSGSEVTEHLKRMRFECIIVDEAHRARRRSVNGQSVWQRAEPNNLMRFLLDISPRTKSMLLATATPVQLHPIEAWDLLCILAIGNDQVFGNDWSEWYQPQQAIAVVMGNEAIPDELGEAWRWIRNPLPPAVEERSFKYLRRELGLPDDIFVASGSALDQLRPPALTRLKGIIPDFGRKHNPFIRPIVRRTREFLEQSIDPTTGEPYLKPVRVKLVGEAA